MKHIPGWPRAAVMIIGLTVASAATATTGYFGLGYGAKAMGLAGAVVSNPQDSIAAAVNPAGVGLVGERVDAGLRFFSPTREAELNTSVLGAGSNFGAPYDIQDNSRRNLFLIPNIGYTRKLNETMTWGISMYGNGGMNTTYDRNLFDETAAIAGAIAAGGAGAADGIPQGTGTGSPETGTLGVDLAQALIAPTIAMKVKENHTVGVSLLIGIQRFSARGLGNFSCLTSSVQANIGANPSCATTGYPDIPSTKLTDNNSDWSYGAGLRVGWIGELSPVITAGVAVASKVYMTELDDYSELFAEQGDFDIPANFSVGVTFKATPKLKLSFDFQRILYEGVNSISNPGPVPGPAPPPGGGFLGADNGLGFGWEDINIYRLAAEYNHNSQWIYRAGFAFNDQPIGSDDVTFNILAPAVVEKHATVGFTFMPDKTSEWSFAYMHAFEETVSTSASAFGVPGSITMYQNSLDLSYSKKF